MGNLGYATFGRVISAMVTPFSDDFELDLSGAIELARWQIEIGNDALVLGGTTGEGSQLSHNEKYELYKTVSRSLNAPVIVSVGSLSTKDSVELARMACEIGVAGILVVTPYYVRPSQQGLFEHFSAVAKAAGKLPVMLYDIPIRTGRKIELNTLRELVANCPNILAIKDASADLIRTPYLISELEKLEVYSGDDSLTFNFVSLGAVGVVSVASNWYAAGFQQMIKAIDEGDLIKARKLNQKLLPCYEFETSEKFPNPVPAKTILNVIGKPAGKLRPPMNVVSEELTSEAAKLAKSLDLI